MLFNSPEFAIFLPLVFLLYWFVFNRSVKIQNLFLLLVGYVFYGWWDWRFLFLIAFSTLLDFTVGTLLGAVTSPVKRKWIFAASIAANLGFLGFFKYYNFFVESFIAAVESLGYHVPSTPLKIILPVGISFYTFQSLSYTIDVYKRKMQPTRDLVSFAAFISFFPQLVAGPIERAFHLLPQFYKPRTFDVQEAVAGLRQMLWGFFKKIVIADTLSGYVDAIFSNYEHLPNTTLLLGAIYFSIQIYCDFSGYSSIAIGVARLFGFSLMRNFNYPYFSESVAVFWRNWHISLTSWFRDYVYIPLGGSRGSKGRTVFNTLVVFTVSGLWHGANWTFIAWGFLNGLFIIPSVLRKKQEEPGKTSFVWSLLKMGLTFVLIMFTWVFFRSPHIHDALQYIQRMCSVANTAYPVQHGMALAVPLIVILLLVEWGLKHEYRFVLPQRLPLLLRWSIYLVLAVTCLAFFQQNQAFIYFQF